MAIGRLVVDPLAYMHGRIGILQAIADFMKSCAPTDCDLSENPATIEKVVETQKNANIDVDSALLLKISIEAKVLQSFQARN